jgi:hypothetical protein
MPLRSIYALPMIFPTHHSKVLAFVSFVPLALAATVRPIQVGTSYSRQVAPLLRAHCISCHSTDNPSGNLDLTSVRAIRKGGISGPTVVAGNAAKSPLLQRILGHGGKPQMPLGFAPLSAEKATIIERWIQEGAKEDDAKSQHWAYIPPTRPNVPKAKNSKWVRNDIDGFVLAGLEKSGISPSPEAPRESLIRRVYLDLTGLPPSVEEVDAFLNDRRPDAYERVVDRLLASSHYGERQARFWLDLARYADTDGFADFPRKAWKYRDWVIQAFNKNMPFDHFTIEQLAGDLLPPGNMDRLIATGFHRNTMFDAEMGGDPEEAHLNVIADRVSTTSTVWLGSTLQCARCHDHKYDPFSQKDFYAMGAFFAGTSNKPTHPGEKKGRWEEPLLPLPTPKQIAARERLRLKEALTDRVMRKWTPEKRTAFPAWKDKVLRPEWKLQRPTISALAPTTFEINDDGSIIARGALPETDKYRLVFPRQTAQVSGFRLEVLPDARLPKGGSGRAPDGAFVITKVAAYLDGKPVKIADVAADYVGPENDVKSLLEEEDPAWSNFESADKPHELAIEFEKPLTLSESKTLVLELSQEDVEPYYLIGKFRVSFATVANPAGYIVSAEVRELLGRATLDKKQQEKVDDAFFDSAPMFAAQRREIRKVKQSLEKLDDEIPTAMILQEHAGKEPLKLPLRIRGEFVDKGSDIEASTPGILPPIERNRRVDRLALAKWLVSPDNPLTARVLANRLWEQSFGRGIVETSEDFGTRGSLPTHPELLDWMACELQNGWNVKALQRKIVTSATYRQSSRSTKEGLERDPKNALLARGPKVRMDAETVRDASLAFGGILSRKVGGPSVFPYQPSEATENNMDWEESHGADANRRSLYTFLQRAYPFPLFQLFDGANRLECTVRRVNTTTPLQALAMMNDLGMKRAAEGLGSRMIGAGGTDEQKLMHGFRICTSRRPNPTELNQLQRLLTQMRTRYAADGKSAKALSGSPERSTWTMVGNVLLNMDETINRN